MDLQLNKIGMNQFRGLREEERDVVGFALLLKDEGGEITDTALKKEFDFLDVPAILDSLAGKNILVKK